MTQGYIEVRFLRLFFYLVIGKGFNYIFPIIVVPLLVNRIGIEGYGYVTLGVSLSTIAAVVVDWGFKIKGVTELSQNLGRKATTIRIYKESLAVQSIILASLLILSAVVELIFEKAIGELSGFIFLMVLMGGVEAILPVWVFHARKEMKYVTFIIFSQRMIFLLLIYLFLETDADILLYPLFGVLLAIICFLILHRKLCVGSDLGANISGIKLDDVFSRLKGNVDLAGSKIIVLGYSQVSIITASMVIMPAMLGVYGIASRLVGIYVSFIGELARAVIPYSAESIKNSELRYNLYEKRYYLAHVFLFSVFSLILLTFGRQVIDLFLSNGDEVDAVYRYAIWLLVYGFFSPLCNFFTNKLVVEGKERWLRRIVLEAAILSMLITYPLCRYADLLGLVILMSLSQVYIFIRILFLFNGREIENKELHPLS